MKQVISPEETEIMRSAYPETNRGVFCCGKRLFSHFNVAEAELKSR